MKVQMHKVSFHKDNHWQMERQELKIKNAQKIGQVRMLVLRVGVHKPHFGSSQSVLRILG